MNDVKQLPRKSATIGDAAVDGLLAGVSAGLAMGAYLILAGLVMGEALADIVARFRPGDETDLLNGLLLHLALAGFYGIAFGIGRWLIIRDRSSRGIDWAIGLMYALVLLFLAVTVTLPRTNSPLLTMPLAHLVIAHLAFGLTLGTVIHRVGGSTRSN